MKGISLPPNYCFLMGAVVKYIFIFEGSSGCGAVAELNIFEQCER
jgi:hypothetical protein